MDDQQDLDTDKPFWVADWQVDPSACRLIRADIEVKLEPKAMSVLCCLAKNAGLVMSREELERQVWQDVVVGYDSLAGAIIKLRKAFGDDKKNPRIIETVSKRGYRLIAEVGREAGTGEGIQDAEARRRANPARLLVTTGIVVLVGLLLFWFAANQGTGPQRLAGQKPSIVVLPFKNLSDDPEQDYFIDGMTGDIITDLSKISGISVISRNSAFTYKDSDIDPRELGRQLNVAYVVEGSIQKSGDAVRISARLIDARTSRALWADRFDGVLKDVFLLQDEVTKNIVNSLAIKLTENERKLVVYEYTQSVEAYDEFLKGWQQFWIFSKESNHRARGYFLKAIELDSNFARAYANLALTHTYDYMNAWVEDKEKSKQLAMEFAMKGVDIDPGIPQVHWVMGLIQMFNKDYPAALEHAQKTLKENPNYADGHGLMATILNYAGKPKEALGFMETAMSLNPHHPSIYKIIRGEIHFNLHDYDNAIANFLVALERNPEAQEPRLWLAAAYAHKGEIDEASWQLEYLKQSESSLTLEHIEEVSPFKDPAHRRHYLDGLRKAGFNAGTDSGGR